MAQAADPRIAAGDVPRRLFFYNGGFATERRLRRILALAGHDLCIGLPGPSDGVVVWGRSPQAWRGERIARLRDVPLVRVEDAFLRSIRPGRMGDAGLGLLIDGTGVHFDSAAPSSLEVLLATHPLDDPSLLQRACDGIGRIRAADLSKYNLHDPSMAIPAPGYVLVVDQTHNDAAIHHSGASAVTFAAMLAAAKAENPGMPILIKAHPETIHRGRAGHFTTADAAPPAAVFRDNASPWQLLTNASRVYTVSSQLGFEAIMAGHRPRVFGQPFYAGWGLSDDENPVQRRNRRLTVEGLFAAAMILAPTWFDPCRNQLCSFEQMVDHLEASVGAFRIDRFGHVGVGIRLWKRGHMQAAFGQQKRLLFARDTEQALALARRDGRGVLVWAGKETPALAAPGIVLRRVEDGFLRSRGLGANLVPPLSLVTDDLGIYYDPHTESRLERLIKTPPPPGGRARAERLIAGLIAARLSKYNLGGKPPALPDGQRILVPGQVEDDASILRGAGDVRTNLALLRAVRAANPQAILIYKPHPDVEAGLRPGVISPADLAGLADVMAVQADPITLIEHSDSVWTMTSLLGFEALIRGKPVTCLGTPFYTGWGLTTDLGPIPSRRAHDPAQPRTDLVQLVYAALIAYPRYYDPVSKLACPPEVAVERLAQGRLPGAGPALRLLAKVQGAAASYAGLWRR